jgi:hypothetical protein
VGEFNTLARKGGLILKAIILTGFLYLSLLASTAMAESTFKLSFEDCKIINASLNQKNTVNFTNSPRIEADCARDEKKVTCDYHYSKGERFRILPMPLTVDRESDDHLFIYGSYGSPHIRIDKKKKSAILETSVGYEKNADFTGSRVCSGVYIGE